MTETSNTAVSIKDRLRNNRLSQVWLIHELSKMGIVTCDSELSAILNGARKGPKSAHLIEASGAILDSFETAEKVRLDRMV